MSQLPVLQSRNSLIPPFMHTYSRSFLGALLALWLGSIGAHAHQVGESYLFLQVREMHIDGQVHTTVSDLDDKIGIDANGDGKVTEEELKLKLAEATDYVSKNVALLNGDEPMALTFTGYEMLKISLGQYVIFPFRTPDLAPVPNEINIRMSVFFDSDPKQRARVILEENAKTGEINNVERVALDFVPGDDKAKSLDLTETYSPVKEFMKFVWEGIWHIWIGLDHILFLAALVLPAVLVLRSGRWDPVEGFRPALWNVTKIVTCFTLAHSITFSLAALGIVSLSSRVVESIIALSVMLAALNNLWPIMKKTWVIVFLFGLFHGFGFASVFGDLLSDDALTIPLIGFNVGVELGQVAILLALFPILYVLRQRKEPLGVAILIAAGLVIAFLVGEPWWILVAIALLFVVLFLKKDANKPYIHAVLYGGSVVIAIRAAVWFAERAFNLG